MLDGEGENKVAGMVLKFDDAITQKRGERRETKSNELDKTIVRR